MAIEKQFFLEGYKENLLQYAGDHDFDVSSTIALVESAEERVERME